MTKTNNCAYDHPANETKYASVTIDKISTAGQFSGYASVFGEVDMGNDIVSRGAFGKCLRTKSPADVRMLFQHNPDEPVGVWQEIREDEKGLFVSGALSTTTCRARELNDLMRQGAIDGLSIGFKTIRSKKQCHSDTRIILEADLWEISIVTFPMQANARIEELKNLRSRNVPPTTRQFERWLTRDVGLSRREARTVIAKGFAHLTGKRDAVKTTSSGLAQSIRRAAQAMAADAASERRI